MNKIKYYLNLILPSENEPFFSPLIKSSLLSLVVVMGMSLHVMSYMGEKDTHTCKLLREHQALNNDYKAVTWVEKACGKNLNVIEKLKLSLNTLDNN